MSKTRQLRKEARSELKANAAQYPKDRFELIPQSQWPIAGQNDKRIKLWCSRQFLVQAFQERGGVIRLTVTKNKLGFGDRTFADGVTWDELQWIKSAVGYGDRMAVEIYPEDALIVNDCNMRHLWILASPIDIGWRN
jgi:hypothetical protein